MDGYRPAASARTIRVPESSVPMAERDADNLVARRFRSFPTLLWSKVTEFGSRARVGASRVTQNAMDAPLKFC